MIATTRYSAILSKSYPDGTALASNIAPIRKRGNGRQGMIVSEANVLRIRSKESGETIHALVAVQRNSRSAALLRRGTGR
jgi:hypothetical protein